MTPPTAEPDEPITNAGREIGLSIAEVAERTGLSRDTLRYYEKAGLIRAVTRSAGGRRRYAAADLDWLGFLLRLRATGMPIADMQRFAVLRQAGDRSIAARLALLRDHRDHVQRHVRALQGHLDSLDTKIDHYQGQLDQQAGTDDV